MKHLYTSLSFIFAVLYSNSSLATTYWDWRSIDVHNIQLPASFEWGTTSILHEVEGYSESSTWYAWQNHQSPYGTPFTLTRSGNPTEHARNYKEDVQLIKDMGLSTYCICLDWSRIEPKQGVFNEEELRYCSDLCDELICNNIAPVIVLKSPCDPLWFGYLGGFENEKNIYLFERYCLKVYNTLRGRVSRWITFWAPEAYAMLGYLVGSIPPGISNVHKAATVLKNELEAHVRVYKAIKEAPQGNTTCIGIIKHVHPLEPWHVWDRASCYLANMLTNDSFYSFFTTGTYSVKLPIPGRFGAWVKHTNTFAPKSLDFVGINYYSHGYIKNIVNHVSDPSEMATDLPGMTVYPEGLYEAIKEVSTRLAAQLNIPMVITQNGVATTNEDVRTLYMQRHIYAVSKAVRDGFNVQGYYYYSLLDGFAWGSAHKKFGLFSVDAKTHTRTQKSGSRYYAQVAQNN